MTTYARNLEDLTRLICPPDRSSRLSLSIPSDIVEEGKLLVPDKAYFGPNGVIPDGLYVCLGWPKGLESRKDMWREAPLKSHS